MLFLFIFLVIIFILLNIFDAITTFYVVSKYSYTSERNPMVRFLIKKYGIKKGLIYTKFIIIFILPLIIWSYIEHALSINIVLIILNIFYLLVVLNNYNIYRKILLDKKSM